MNGIDTPALAHGHAPSWIPPPTGRIKFKADMRLGRMMIKEPWQSLLVVATGSLKEPPQLHLKASRTLEAIVYWEALSLANDLLVIRACVANDCLRAITSIQKGTRGSYGQFWHEISARIEAFEELASRTKERGLNMESHRLAWSDIHTSAKWSGFL